MSDTFRHQEAVEWMVREFGSIITADASYRQLDLKFYFFDKVYDNLQCFGFESEEEYQSKAIEAINYNQYVFLMMETSYGRWTA